MRVLVCGGRHYNNFDKVFAVLNGYDAEFDFSMVIQGGASGADNAAKEWARIGNIPCREFAVPKKHWKEYGKAAGPMRNQRMIDEGKPELVIAFPGGRGTNDMVTRARMAGIEVREVR